MVTTKGTGTETKKNEHDAETSSQEAQPHPSGFSRKALHSSSSSPAMAFKKKSLSDARTLDKPENPNTPSKLPHLVPAKLIRNRTPPTEFQTPTGLSRAVSPKPPVRRESSDVIERAGANEKQQGAILVPDLPRNRSSAKALASSFERERAIVTAREQVVNEHVFGINRKKSISQSNGSESDSTHEGSSCQIFSNQDRRISSLTFMSRHASLAPGERSFKGLFHGHNRNIPPRPMHVTFSTVTEERLSPPEAFDSALFPVRNEPLVEDEEVSSTLPRHRQHAQGSHDRSWSLRILLRPFVSPSHDTDSRSDEATHSSRATARTLLSAAWLLVLPTRRSASAVRPVQVTRIPDQALDRKKITAIALGTCGCVMLAAVLAVILWYPASSTSQGMEVAAPTMLPSLASSSQQPTSQNEGDIFVPGKPTVSTARPRQLDILIFEPVS